MRSRMNYINNKELHCELIVSKAQGRLTERSKKAIILICKKMGSKFYYKNPEDRKDCEQEAMLNTFKRWYNYDENKTTNAFAYLSEVAKRSYAKAFNDLNKNGGSYDKHISIERGGKDGGSLYGI